MMRNLKWRKRTYKNREGKEGWEQKEEERVVTERWNTFPSSQESENGSAARSFGAEESAPHQLRSITGIE